ncbi:3862_t:CDS:1, partial [Funneliformis geosporum]
FDVGKMEEISSVLELVLESEKGKIINMTKLNNRSYQYPERDREIIAKLSDPNYEVKSHVFSKDAPVEDLFKYEVCQTIFRYQQEHKIPYEKFAEQIGLSFAEAMKVLKGKINDFYLGQLIFYFKKMAPEQELKLTPSICFHCHNKIKGKFYYIPHLFIESVKFPLCLGCATIKVKCKNCSRENIVVKDYELEKKTL